MLNGTSPPKPPRKAPEVASGNKPLLTQVLLSILAEMPAQFNTLDVDKVFRAVHPEMSSTSRSTITHTLK